MVTQECRACGESWGGTSLIPCPFCGFDTHNHNLKPPAKPLDSPEAIYVGSRGGGKTNTMKREVKKMIKAKKKASKRRP